VDPVPDPQLFFLVVPGIEPGPPDLITASIVEKSIMIRGEIHLWLSMTKEQENTYLHAID
jgi:hypothetical protein